MEVKQKENLPGWSNPDLERYGSKIIGNGGAVETINSSSEGSFFF